MRPDRSTPTRLFTLVLGITFVLAITGLVVLAAGPEGLTEKYTQNPDTEFYLLGPEGKATDYPRNLTVGDKGTVIVGINNYEHEIVEYTLVVETTNETLVSRQITVADDEQWRDELSFSFSSPGQKVVSFELYRGPTTRGKPYRDLYLQITVTPE